jgi:hypothetical protein
MAKKRKPVDADSLDTQEVETMNVEVTSDPKIGEKEKKRAKFFGGSEKGSLSPFAFLITLLMLGGLSFLVTYKPTSSSLIEPKTNNALRILLSITNSDFATEGSASGSLDICRGTKDFPNIDKAVVYINDTNNRPLASIPVSEANSKDGSICKYELEAKSLPDFPGTKLNIYVQFNFGTSNTFLVDVGSEPPFKKVNIRLTLG